MRTLVMVGTFILLSQAAFAAAPLIQFPSSTVTVRAGDLVDLTPQLEGFRISPQCQGKGEALFDGGSPLWSLRTDSARCKVQGAAPLISGNYRYTVTSSTSAISASIVLVVVPGERSSGLFYPSSELSFHSGEKVHVVPLVRGLHGKPAQCAARGLPEGLSIDSQTCVITGSMTAARPQTLHVEIDANGLRPAELSIRNIASQ